MSTLGPLTVHEEPERTYSDGTVDKGGYRIDGPGIDQVAFVWRENRRCSPLGGQEVGELFGDKQAKEYADLFATAPDLLAAAVKALADCCDLIGTEAGRALEAAIAKATGADQ